MDGGKNRKFIRLLLKSKISKPSVSDFREDTKESSSFALCQVMFVPRVALRY